MRGWGLRDAQRGGVFTIQETAFESLDLRRRMAALVARPGRDPENRRLARHLTRLLRMDQLFLFLREAGHRRHEPQGRAGDPPRGREPQGLGRQPDLGRRGGPVVLMSILRTAAQRGHDVLQTVSRMLGEARPHRRAALLLDST